MLKIPLVVALVFASASAAGCAQSHEIQPEQPQRDCSPTFAESLGVGPECVHCFVGGGYSVDSSCFVGRPLLDLGPTRPPELPVDSCSECIDYACDSHVEACVRAGISCVYAVDCWEQCSAQDDPDILPCELPICEEAAPIGFQTFGCVLLNCADECSSAEFHSFRAGLAQEIYDR
jgi:hypothetical protein